MSERKEEMICINCPRGCRLTVRESENGEITVSGNFCGKGTDYGIQELREPKRILTCLMRVAGVSRPISVKTDKPVPKEKLMEIAREIYRTHPEAPVNAGDIVIADILGTGSNVVATRGAAGRDFN